MRTPLVLLAATAALLLAAAPAQASPAVALIPGNDLLVFDTSDPATVRSVGVFGLGANETLRGVDLRLADGQLYGTTVTAASGANSVLRTYRIDTQTGRATFVGATAAALAGAGDIPTGFALNPVVDRLRYMNINDDNARLNPNDGALAANDTDLTPAATTSVIGAAYDRSVSGATATTLFAIDQNTSQLAMVGGVDGSPSANGGVVTDLGALGFTLHASNDGGFDIGPDGVARAGLTDGADDLTRTTHAIDDATQRLSRFLGAQSLLCAAHGAMVAAGLAAIGIPGALLWGALGGLLRFIPYVGPWIAAALPIALSLAAFPGWYATWFSAGYFAVYAVAFGASILGSVFVTRIRSVA